MMATGLLVAGGLSFFFGTPRQTPPSSRPSAPPTHTHTPAVSRAIETLGQRPLGFERNQGQFTDGTKFAARGTGYGIFLGETDAVLSLRRADADRAAAIRMSVIGAQPSTLTPSEPLSGTIRYYRGQGASSVSAETQAYARVTRHNVYDGIDLVYYGNQQRLEYDFVVAPGRDPRAIRVQFTGADRMEVEPASGDLLLHVAGGDPVRQHKPITYQVIDGTRREVESRYVLADDANGPNEGRGEAGSHVSVEVGAYDTTQPLVIDPVLTYSTYFGSVSEETIADIAVDGSGYIYVTGRTEDAPEFPTTQGAYQTTKPGKRDGFVSKFNPAGTALIFSTFLGGSEDDNATEHINRMAIDATGAVYITGTTLSANYPITAATADDSVFNGEVLSGSLDGYYTKLNPAGGLEYSTFIGGSKSDLPTGIAVDSNGNVYISGGTASSPADGFVLTAGAVDSTFAGSKEAFLVKFNAAGQKVYATYFGGSSSEQTSDLCGGLAIDDTGKAYLVSDTYSTDLTIVNGAQTTNTGGQQDGFLAVIDTTKAGAAGLVYSTYMGGTNVDSAYAVAYAGNGQVVVVGDAQNGFPTKNAVDGSFNGGIKDVFVAKYDTTQTGANSLLWSTFLGGQFREQANDVAVDPAGGIHIVGETSSPEWPLYQAIQPTLWQTQPFVIKLTANGQSLVYSTFLGSNTNKQGLRAVAANAVGETYVGGYTWNQNTNPPNPQGHLVRNPYQPGFGGGDGDGWIAKIGFDADAQITMAASPEPVLPGQEITYTISVNNNSTDPAANVVVTDSLPNQTSFVSCTATAGGVCGGNGNTRTVTFATLPGNGLATITIKAKLNLGLPPAFAFDNIATLTSTTTDSNQANNTADAVSHTPTLEPTGDADGDGLPNGWEKDFGLDPFDNGTGGGSGGANGDPDGDGKTNLQEYLAGTHPRGFVITYLAEGATGAFFDTRLAIANPGQTNALVLLRFQSTDGKVVRHYLQVNAHSRATIDVQNIAGMESVSFSTLVEADEIVVVDRTMSWDKTGYGSHAERGTLTRTATTWYLAEGATHGNFSLFYLIQNAGTTQAEVDVKFLLPAPQPPVTKHYSIPADSRFNVNVDEIPELSEAEMSAIITSTNGVPIVVERAMYLDTPTQAFAAGHGSAGATAPATKWFLAEGATGPFFDMFILIGNPTDQDARIEAKYQLIGGGVITKTYTVAANSRFNIMVDNEGPELANAAVSTTLTSTNGVPVVVERTMWFPGPTAAQWREAHNSFGETQTGTRWAMAEGEQGGPRNAETYILIANTSDVDGSARVRLLFEDGSTTERTFPLVRNSRTNVQVSVDYPEAAGKRFGAVIESLGGNPVQIVVERAMYTSPNGDTWSAGTNAVATKLP